MTNPTLERAARALALSFYQSERSDSPQTFFEQYGTEDVEAVAKAYWREFVTETRAVLMAVRADEKIASMVYEAESVAHCDWDKIWQRQIDAILNEEDK